jgi:hypothetical protein
MTIKQQKILSILLIHRLANTQNRDQNKNTICIRRIENTYAVLNKKVQAYSLYQPFNL